VCFLTQRAGSYSNAPSRSIFFLRSILLFFAPSISETKFYPISPLFESLEIISSTAAFDGAQIKSFLTPDAKSMETIPVIVCVFPVPG
jgi:hypothetical protein